MDQEKPPNLIETLQLYVFQADTISQYQDAVASGINLASLIFSY